MKRSNARKKGKRSRREEKREVEKTYLYRKQNKEKIENVTRIGK